MYQILYTSEASKPFKDDELKDLLAVARHNNFAKSITGMLLYCNSSFIQLLEGTESDLYKLFNNISADPRHTNVKKILTSEIEKPQFPDWSMGYKFLTPEQLMHLAENENNDVIDFIRKTKPFKLLKLLSCKSWN